MKTKTNSQTTRANFTSTRLTKRVTQRAPIYFAALFCFALLSSNAFAQLTGTKNIPGDYPTIFAAVTDLNTQGVGAGGVTFNVAAGYVENLGSRITLTATGTVANQIIFQKSGAGANPVINAYVGVSTPGSATPDGMWALQGSDYVTIDGIDLTDPNGTNNATMEYGYGLFKASATDGAQNNTIKNCTITLNRVNNATGGAPMVDGSVGIAVMNSTPTAATTALTVTSAAGSNSNNKFYTNTIQNCNIGMALIGFADVTPFTFADTNNDVGGASAATGNQILNFGGGAATNAAAGVRTLAQYGINISFNTVNNNNGAGVNHATTLRGIYNNTATSANVTISNNTVTVKSGATTSALIAIENDAGATAAGNTVSINNNTITGCTYTTATTGTFQGIFNSGVSAANVNINNNIFTSNATNSASGVTTFIQQTGAATVAVNINNNNINGWTFNAACSGTLTGITTAGASTSTVSINGNNFQGIVHSVAGTSAHNYITNTAATTRSYNSNTFTNLNVNTSGAVTFFTDATSLPATGTESMSSNSIVTGFTKAANGAVTIRSTNASSAAGSSVTWNLNNFSNITLAGTSAFNGFINTDGGSPAKTITNNTLNSLTISGGTSGAIVGMSVNFVGGTTTSVSNNTITNLTGQGAITGILIGTSGSATTFNASGNVVTGLTSNGTGGAVTGLSYGNPSTTGNVTNNTVNTLSSTGASSTVVGLTITGGTTVNASGNTINTISGSGATSPVVNGLSVSSGTTVNVFKNKIYGLSQSGAISTTSPAINGVLLSGGTTVNTYNNIVGALTAPAASLADAIRGISVTSTATSSTQNVYYNTVRIPASSTGANFGTTGIFHAASATATTATLNLRNNAIVNVSTPAGTGLVVAFRRSAGTAGTLANYASTSNNNDFYAGTPGASNLIYSDGTSTAQTVSAYKSGAFTAGTIAPRDSASFGENPPFLSTTGSSATFLHIDPTIATQLESGGSPIGGITDDFDGDTRNVSTPDVGADEFAGTPLDLSPPNISYTPLGNTNSLSNRSFTNVTITDPSGVNGTLGTRPRVYYKKASDGSNTFNDNTSATTGWKYVEANGSTSQFDFTIDYSLIFTGSVIVGDVIQYVVVAQDNAATPNVGINSGTFNATPSSVALTAAAFPITGTINSYQVQGNISGTFNVGIGQTYADLTAAVNAVNTNFLIGPVTFLLTDASYTSGPGGNTPLAFPLTINANPGSSMTNTITIKPAPGVVSTITGSVASGALLTVKANWVIIDGSNSGGTDRSMTITNTNATSPSVLLFGSSGTTPVTNDTLKNCVIINGVNTSSAVVISDATTLGNAGFFSNITVQNNSIQKAFVGVFATGGTTPQNGSNLIYTQNDLSTSGANAIRNIGLYMQGVNGATVSNNTVGNFETASAENDVGIWLATGTINATVSGNTVSGLSCTNTSGAPIGINVTPAVAGNVNDVISQNSVSNLATLGSTAVFGIVGGSTSGDAITIDRNNVQNIQNNNTSTFGAFGIVLNGGNNHIVKNNFVSNVNHNMTGGAAFSTTFGVFGMSVNTGTGHKVYHNSVNMFGVMPGTATTSLLSAAFSLVSTASTGCDVRNNIFSNTMTGGTTSIAHVSTFLPPSATSAMNLTWNNNAMFTGTTAGVHGVCHVGTTYTSPPSGPTTYAGLYPAGSFVPSSTAGISNLRSYTSTLLAANTNNDNASQASTAAAPFTSNTDLHISTGVNPTPLESGGASAASTGVTTDIDGQVRPGPAGSMNGGATAPDLGADEFDGVPLFANDMSATAFISPTSGGGVVAGATFSPVASFTNTGTANQTNVTVRYRILDATLAEVYNNTQVIASINSGVSTPVTFASTSLAAGTYTIKAKAELVGDQVPANDEITGSISAQAPLSGNYTVGAAGNYTTITQAVNALNSLGVSGPVVLTLLDSSNTMSPQNTGEVFPITLNAIPGASSTNTVTMKPANPGTSITGSNASALFILNGTSWVTIDGSSNGTSSQDLTITNSNASAAGVIWLKSNGTGLGATNNTIKNLNIVGGSVTATYGIALSGATIGTAGADNDNNTLQNNSISTVFYGIYANGTAAVSTGGLDGLAITNNTIGPAASGATNTGFVGISVANAVSPSVTGNTVRNLSSTAASCGGIRLESNVTGATVSQNTLNNITSSSIGSGTTSLTGIYVGSAVINTTVSKNSLQTIVSTTTSGYGSRGIMVNTANAASNDTIVNNFITDVYCFQDASAVYWPIGIAIESSTGGVNVYDNSVNLFGQHAGYASNTTGGAAPSFFVNTSVTNLDVRDNIFTSSYDNTTSTGDKAYGIYCASANTAFTTIDYNDYFASGTGAPFLGFLGSDQSTIANWRIATGQDVHSINADPVYVSSTNLHLTTSPIPPVSGAGVTIATVTTDIDGDLRQSPPDMGADEIITYTLTYTAGANGSISGASPQMVVPGGSGTAVTAVPNTGYHFVSWSDASTQNPRTDTNVMANISVTATFAINTYTLTYTAGANGSISGTSPQTVNYGTDGTAVTAVPNTGYHFVNWSDSSTQNPRTDTNVMADVNVTANFAINTYTLTYTAGANGSISGTSPQTVNFGSDGTAVTAVPNTGYHFVNWSDSSTQNPRTDTNVMADISVTANFAINTYTLTYTAGANGTISGASPQTVNYGDSGTAVTAVPNSGYHFVNWSDASTQNPRTDTNVMMDISVTANFVIDGPVHVSGSTGANGDYPSLTGAGGAFAAINVAGSQAGNNILVTIITDVATENGANSLNNGGWTTLTVNPVGARTLSGAIAGALVNLDGASNVTIDGLNTGGNSLTISNTDTGTSTSTIRFINGASSNTVTNGSLLGSSTGAVAAGASGTVFISTSTGGANNGNIISNNNIGPAGANLPTKAVMSLGSASPNNNTGNVLTNNNIFDFFSPTISVAGISLQANTTTMTVSNNRLYQTAARTFTGAGLSYTGITATMATGLGTANITGNTIGFGAANGTGLTAISGSTNTFGGIALNSGSTTTASNIQGNTISGISQSSAGNGVVAFSGIFFASSRCDVGTVTGNKIGSLDGSSTITLTFSSNAAAYMLRDNGSSSNTIANNQIGAITINGTGAGANGFRGILLSPTTTITTTLTNNQIGASGAGAITDSLVGGYAMYAISSSGGNVVATGNTIRNISGNSNIAGQIIVSGMVLTGTGTAGPNLISQNVIHSLSNNSGAASNSIYAMYCSFPAATANVVERNLVHSLSITSTSPTAQLVGILPVAGSGTYRNNMVRLGLDAAGNSISSGFPVYGMFEIGGTNNLYNNSVYIAGTVPAGTGNNTFAFVSNVTSGARSYIDNIFWNARSTTGGTGNNFAIVVSGPGFTSNGNDLYATGTLGFVGADVFLDPTLAAWQADTGQDANSVSGNPQFIAPNGTSTTGDLHISAVNGTPIESSGVLVASVTDDFDGQTRSTLTPTDIGADAGNFVANTPPTISAVPVTRQQGTPVSNSTIANVNDDGGAGAVMVSLISANPSNGVTISNIVNTNGTVTADVVASCTATNATFTLQASDGTSTNAANVTVTVTANSAPTLSYNNASVPFNGSTMINPATGPSDNGSVVSIVVQSAGTYTGTISVDNTTGIVSISNAAPAGTHTITIRATDNCGMTTDATFMLTVAVNNYTLTYTAGANGTISGTSPQTVPAGGSGTPVTAVPDAGYHFVNWSDSSTQNPRTDTNVMADISVTANFAINTYTVTYDGNTNTGGTAPVDPNSPYNYNSTVTVLGQGTLTKTGSTFSGWNTAANGSGTSYSPGATFSITVDTTLFAQWTRLPATTVYVDDDWTGLPNGVDPDGGGPATEIGYDAFATIQGGVDGVANPGTVIVYAGTYLENVSVNKALNIQGPNAGIPGSSNARVAEAFVRTVGAAQNAVFTVTSNNVTLNGFSLDGDDPGFTGVTLGSGEDTNTSYAVRPSGNNHIVVRDNIIKRVAIGFRGDGASQNNLITENWFDSVGFFDFGYAVSLRTNYYADVVDNLMTRVWTGLHTNNFSAAGGPATWLISTNEIHSYAAGILYWLQYGSATSATFDNNSMSAETGAVANNFGMLMVSVQNAINPTLTNNSVDGTDYGIGLTNTSTTNVITFDDTNSISGTNIAGVYLTDNLTFNPVGTTDLTTNAYTGPANAIAVTINGGAINVNSGTGVKVQNSRTSAADVSSTAVVTGTSIAGVGGKGVEVLGPMTTMNLTGALIDGMDTAAHVDATSSGANAVTLTVTNSTLSGSTAATGGALNAVGTGGMAKVTITNSTLTGNSPSGAGILLQDATLTIGNTIFNTSGSGTNISALGTSLVSSLGFNLSSDGFGGFLTGTGDQVNTDPMLGPLKYNGGPTFTFAPLEGSPAIDHGKDIGPFGPGHTATGEDQRGFTRPVDDPDIANAVGGDGSDIGAVELAIGVHPSSAASRKTHGPAGDFDVSLPLSGPVGIECRGTGAATNLYTMVLLFENPVTFSGAAVTSGTGMVDSVTASNVMVAGVAETQVTINLSGVADVQTLTVGLFDVNDGVHMGDVGVRMHLMIGDATGNGAVNSSDVSFVKSRLGQPVDGTNFRADITANGGINASDVTLTKSKLP